MFRALAWSVLGIYAAGVAPVLAQQRPDVRPDAGILLDSPSPLPCCRPAAIRRWSCGSPRPRCPLAGTARITPAGFRFNGNTVFSGELLAALLASRLHQPTDLTGLTEAANTISAYYRQNGYLLTQAYLPEQAF
jgi:hemolysin activation/secretion protein